MRGAEWVEKDVYKPREDAMRFEDWDFAYALVLGTRAAIEYFLETGADRVWQQVKLLSGYMRQELSLLDKVRVLDRGPETGGLVTFTVKGRSRQLLKQVFFHRHVNPKARSCSGLYQFQ